MTQIFNILASALSSTPTAIIPFVVTLALIGYLSFKIYQEFRKVYKKCNADKLELVNRIAESERKLALNCLESCPSSEGQGEQESSSRKAVIIYSIQDTKKLKCPLVDAWIKNLWLKHTMGYYSVIERRKICICDSLDGP